MNTQNDTTPLTAQTYNSLGQLVPGVPVTVTVGGSLTFEVESGDRTTTLIYDQGSNALDFIDNATETFSGSVALPDFADMALFSTDGTKVYAPVRNVPITGARPGRGCHDLLVQPGCLLCRPFGPLYCPQSKRAVSAGVR